jgi:hypothetical protein
MDNDIRAQLEAAGERRRQGLAMADSALEDAVDLLPLALSAGMTKDEVAELAGVSRQALDAVNRRRRKDPEYQARMHGRLDDVKDVLDQLAAAGRRPPRS